MMDGDKLEQLLREKIRTYQEQEESLTQNIYRIQGAVKALAIILKAIEEDIVSEFDKSED